jgi:1-acyl-sn-glycerol-3-phosphate acyltransferase
MWETTITAILIIYLAFVYVIDKDIPRKGGRRSSRVCNWKLWQIIASYFPTKIVVKSPTNFKPNKPYFFCIHPHGILSLGALANFIPDNAGMRAAVGAQIDARICSLKLALMIPFFRELLLALGFVSASAESIRFLAKNGKSAMLVIGGAEESLYAYPGSTDLILNKRRGFVKIALETNATLVPVYVFGENDLYNQVPGLKNFQRWLQKRMTFAMPLFYGKGFLPIPYKRPLTMVIGDPVEPPDFGVHVQVDEKINLYHAKYVKALTQLFDGNLPKYGSDLEKRSGKLKIIQ